MFSFLMSSSTILFQVFFGLPTGLLPFTSSSIALLSMLFTFLRFTWWKHLNLIFLNRRDYTWRNIVPISGSSRKKNEYLNTFLVLIQLLVLVIWTCDYFLCAFPWIVTDKTACLHRQYYVQFYTEMSNVRFSSSFQGAAVVISEKYLWHRMYIDTLLYNIE